MILVSIPVLAGEVSSEVDGTYQGPPRMEITSSGFIENKVGYAPITVYFKALVANPEDVTAFIWNFGDGTEQIAERKTEHTYEKRGTYIVSLTIVYVNKEPDNLTYELTVMPKRNPLADWIKGFIPALRELVVTLKMLGLI